MKKSAIIGIVVALLVVGGIALFWFGNWDSSRIRIKRLTEHPKLTEIKATNFSLKKQFRNTDM